jgi:hypothetical protein
MFNIDQLDACRAFTGMSSLAGLMAAPRVAVSAARFFCGDGTLGVTGQA